MLRKLIKYDLKALNRFLIIIHCFLMVFAVLTRFFLTGRITDLEVKTNGILLALTIILYVILIIGVTFGTYIVIGIHFYQNLFSNEGICPVPFLLPVDSIFCPRRLLEVSGDL